MAAWFVYILRCADGSLYTGITKDIGRRIEAHRQGRASRYTRTRLPIRLVYEEEQSDRSSALRREAAIKQLSKADKLAIICG